MTDEEPAAEWVPVAHLKGWKDNPRDNDHVVPALMESIERFGFAAPIVARKADGMIVAGHTRLKAALELRMTEVPVRWMDLTEAEARMLALADNKLSELSIWVPEMLTKAIEELLEEGHDVEGLGFSDDELLEIMGADEEDEEEAPAVSMVDVFGVPPFTLLDSRMGYWQDRKRAWVAMGIHSEEGRCDETAASELEISKARGQRMKADLKSNLQGSPRVPEWAREHTGMAHISPGTSIFDPVLAELLVRWFSPEGSSVLDPFAGGSVRGIVSAMVGRDYTGIDLRPEQVDANERQWHELQERYPSDATGSARWVAGDSRDVLLDGEELSESYDLILSCPPYGDLEVYSEDDADLSAMTHEDFLTAYRQIIAQAVDRLAPDSFAAWVVGDFRDERGIYRNFVGDTISAFLDAGMELYNEAILVTPLGTLQLRAARWFRSGRKLGKTHQNVLVFVKGNPQAATARCGEVDFTVSEDVE